MKQKFRSAIINDPNHSYYLLTGKATYPKNEYGNVMFYPDEESPYRTCVKESSIEWIK